MVVLSWKSWKIEFGRFCSVLAFVLVGGGKGGKGVNIATLIVGILLQQQQQQ